MALKDIGGGVRMLEVILQADLTRGVMTIVSTVFDDFRFYGQMQPMQTN